jgi:hypothetical protein
VNGNFSETAPFTAATKMVNGDDGAGFNLVLPGATPKWVDAILVTNTDVILHTIQLDITLIGTGYHLGQAEVPAGSGVGALPPVDILKVILGASSTGMGIEATTGLNVTDLEAITVATEIDTVAVGGTL